MPRRPALLAVLLAACAHATNPAHDASNVELLRLQISKVRHAIEETRETITRSQGAPYLPELYLRLAELTSEEAKYHYRVAREREQATEETTHVPQVRLLKELAIGIYQMILRRFPEAAIGDQVLFNIGHEHRELGNFDDLRTTYERLVRDYPSSRFRPEALLVLGDYYFDRNELETSRRYYEQITTGDESRVTDLAHYKLAWVWVNLGDCEKALVAFERALEVSNRRGREATLGLGRPAARTGDGEATAGGAGGESSPRGGDDGSPALGQAIDVRRAALVDLVYCYSQEREAEDAVPYLREHAFDRATYVAALERMARRFGVMDNAVGALAAVRELLRLGAAGSERLEDARQLHTALRALGKFERVGADVESMLRVLERHVARVDVTDEMREQVRAEFEVYARDLLTRAQEAVDRLAEERRRPAAGELAGGYAAYAYAFPQAEELPSMLLNMSDLLATAGQNFEAGQRALAAASLVEEPATRRDALYTAVARFQDALAGDTTTTNHRDRVVARAALRGAGRELLRYDLDAEKVRRVKFGIAQSYYDEGLYREAIDQLTAVAIEFRGSEESIAAIRLVLDSFNTLNDTFGLLQAGQRFLAPDSPATAELRAEIQPIVAAAEQRMLDDVSLEAAGDEGGDLSLLLEFARSNRGNQLGERALMNAFVAARAQGSTDELYTLGAEISEAYPNSEQLPGMLSTLGQMAVSRFEVDRALEFLGRAAGSSHPQRTQLLVAAGELLEELGRVDEAKGRYVDALRGADAAAQVVPVERLASLLERQGDPRALVEGLAPYAATGGPEIVSRLGLAQLAAGAAEQAEQTLQSVLSAPGASSAATARANYGMAEIMRRTLDQYPALNDPTLIEEYITIVDVTQQSYLNAARQGDPVVTPQALGRLASTVATAAQRVRTASLPAELADADRQALTQALTERAEQLQQTAREATEACAQQAWNSHVYNPAVRKCLASQSPERVLPAFDAVEARATSRTPRGAEELQQRLARNAEDLEALRELGLVALEGGDPHLARLALSAARERGGTPLETNLLGIAHLRVGATAAALEAFHQAAEAGLEAARQNLAAALRQAGLTAAATAALERIPEGRPGGHALSDVRGGR